MNNKDLLKKLNSLKNIKPDIGWKKNQREILLSQISAGNREQAAQSSWSVVLEKIGSVKILADLLRPAWVMGLVCFLILIAGIGGVYASKNSRPGDSLYIAKIISEKAQLAMTFDQKDKAKLSLEFATNRAKEITRMLKESGADQDGAAAQKDKLEKLSVNFKKEINQAKDNLASISTLSISAEGLRDGEAGQEESRIFGANLEKADQGLEISEPEKPSDSESEAAAPRTLIETPGGSNASSTAQAAVKADKILEEAEKMFDEKNYDGALDKLEEVNKIVNEAPDDGGQVKGASETASSTDNN